jgi:nitrate/nitrite transport system permease protein
MKEKLRSWFASLIAGAVLVLVWQGLTNTDFHGGGAELSEYDKLMGKTAGAPVDRSAMPSPVDVAKRAGELFADPFRRNGENDVGIGLHLYDSLKRVFSGYALAVLVGVPLGFVLGLVPWLGKALDPFIQVLRPVSPMAWMPLALYTLKDSSASAVFIIFICSVWPILINTAFSTSSVRNDWMNVGRVIGLSPWERAIKIVFPASVPMILTGMRISIGIAWLVIVAAEMVVGQSGIGYFVWNEWNNLQISSIIVAIVLIGLVGLFLDQLLAAVMRRLSFRE